MQAIRYHGMHFDHIVTSEDAKSYKPRTEIFHMALEQMRLSPHEVLHIGDSLDSDVLGAHKCGIDSFWLNRKKRMPPDGCVATYSGYTLLDVLKEIS